MKKKHCLLQSCGLVNLRALHWHLGKAILQDHSVEEDIDGKTDHPEVHLSLFSPKVTGTIMGTLFS